MANVIIGFPNRADEPTSIAGGAWVQSLPVENMQDRLQSRVARTIDAAESSATWTLTLTRSRPIRIVALIAHNISFSGRLRIEASAQSDLSAPVLDVVRDVWGALVNSDWIIEDLEWESDNYWLGTYSQEETEGQTAVATLFFDADVDARYWRFAVLDSGNADGYIEIGRLFLSEIFLQPKINYSYGAQFGYEDETGVETALGGVEFFDPRETTRIFRLDLDYLSDAEAYPKALELARRAGVHREVMVIPDADDALYGASRNFLGRLRALAPLEQALFGFNAMSFEIKELR